MEFSSLPEFRGRLLEQYERTVVVHLSHRTILAELEAAAAPSSAVSAAAQILGNEHQKQPTRPSSGCYPRLELLEAVYKAGMGLIGNESAFLRMRSQNFMQACLGSLFRTFLTDSDFEVNETVFLRLNLSSPKKVVEVRQVNPGGKNDAVDVSDGAAKAAQDDAASREEEKATPPPAAADPSKHRSVDVVLESLSTTNSGESDEQSAASSTTTTRLRHKVPGMQVYKLREARLGDPQRAEKSSGIEQLPQRLVSHTLHGLAFLDQVASSVEAGNYRNKNLLAELDLEYSFALLARIAMDDAVRREKVAARSDNDRTVSQGQVNVVKQWRMMHALLSNGEKVQKAWPTYDADLRDAVSKMARQQGRDEQSVLSNKTNEDKNSEAEQGNAAVNSAESCDTTGNESVQEQKALTTPVYVDDRTRRFLFLPSVDASGSSPQNVLLHPLDPQAAEFQRAALLHRAIAQEKESLRREQELEAKQRRLDQERQEFEEEKSLFEEEQKDPILARNAELEEAISEAYTQSEQYGEEIFHLATELTTSSTKLEKLKSRDDSELVKAKREVAELKKKQAEYEEKIVEKAALIVQEEVKLAKQEWERSHLFEQNKRDGNNTQPSGGHQHKKDRASFPSTFETNARMFRNNPRYYRDGSDSTSPFTAPRVQNTRTANDSGGDPAGQKELSFVGSRPVLCSSKSEEVIQALQRIDEAEKTNSSVDGNMCTSEQHENVDPDHTPKLRSETSSSGVTPAEIGVSGMQDEIARAENDNETSSSAGVGAKREGDRSIRSALCDLVQIVKKEANLSVRAKQEDEGDVVNPGSDSSAADLHRDRVVLDLSQEAAAASVPVLEKLFQLLRRKSRAYTVFVEELGARLASPEAAKGPTIGFDANAELSAYLAELGELLSTAHVLDAQLPARVEHDQVKPISAPVVQPDISPVLQAENALRILFWKELRRRILEVVPAYVPEEGPNPAICGPEHLHLLRAALAIYRPGCEDGKRFMRAALGCFRDFTALGEVGSNAAPGEKNYGTRRFPAASSASRPPLRGDVRQNAEKLRVLSHFLWEVESFDIQDTRLVSMLAQLKGDVQRAREKHECEEASAEKE
ncbi:unnamed protein product [Amoebophrya sp. A120]|nr:unnamed protein product [Amoebophrya sp. A120]|eukprot:GSA120T00004213001.1